LEGKEVCVWGWNTVNPFLDANGEIIGKSFGLFLVTSGQISGLAEAVTNACVGIRYTAQFKSTKLAYAAQEAPLTQKKRIDHLAVIANNMHALALQYGSDFDSLYAMPEVEGGQAVDADTIHARYDNESFEFDGEWNTDSRLCLEATSPYPVTLLACVIGLSTHEKY
jgi:hypothetical protein